MTITSSLVENVLKVYTKQLSDRRISLHDTTYKKEELSQDTVTISEAGKRRIIERLKSEAVENLRSKG